MTTMLTFKRGSDFGFTLEWTSTQPVTTLTALAQLRTKAWAPVADLAVATQIVTPTTGFIHVSKPWADTTAWPVAQLFTDVAMFFDGALMRTETIVVDVRERQTDV